MDMQDKKKLKTITRGILTVRADGTAAPGPQLR